MILAEIYSEAGLTKDEVGDMSKFLNEEHDEDFFSSTAYEKLYSYFAFETGEMPYGTAKCRDGDPDFWILEKLGTIL